MQFCSLSCALQQCEFGLATPGLILYPDANTMFDVEANNEFTRILSDKQLLVHFEVWYWTMNCNDILCQVFVAARLRPRELLVTQVWIFQVAFQKVREPQGPSNTDELSFSARMARSANGDIPQDISQVDRYSHEKYENSDLNGLTPQFAHSTRESHESASGKSSPSQQVVRSSKKFSMSLDWLSVPSVTIPPIRKVSAPYMAAGFALATHANAQGRWKDSAPMHVSV